MFRNPYERGKLDLNSNHCPLVRLNFLNKMRFKKLCHELHRFSQIFLKIKKGFVPICGIRG